MKYRIGLILMSVLLVSCKKGKKLPQTVYVYYEPVTSAGISPEDHFAPFDPYDFYETPQYPSYVNNLVPADVATQFNKDLVYWLDRNNIQLTTDSTVAYMLSVTSLHISESLNRQSYTDSCSSWSSAPSYVYYSDLQVDVYATLYKNGMKIDSWHRIGMSSEKVRDKTDTCNKPKIRSALCGPTCLIERVAKELRMKISRKIYNLEGY